MKDPMPKFFSMNTTAEQVRVLDSADVTMTEGSIHGGLNAVDSVETVETMAL